MPATVRPELIRALELYLESRMAEWHSQAGDRNPTLPVTNGGKVNMVGIARDLCAIDSNRKVSDVQYLHQPPCRALINAAAEAQGIGLSASREETDAEDAALGKRIKKTNTDLSDLQKVCSEQAAQIEVMRSRISQLEEKLRLRDDTGMVFRGGL